jgi:hypothetical protein
LLFQAEYWPYVVGFFNWVSESAGIFVLLSGIVAFSWVAFEWTRRGSFFKRKSESSSLSKLLKVVLRIISYSGVVIGILDVWAGTMGLIRDIPPSFKYGAITPHADHFTCIFLIVVGIAMFFKPINDLPVASIVGLLAGTAAAAALAAFIPQSVVVFIAGYIDPKLLLIIVMIVVAAIVALTAKFYIGLLQAISKFLSWPPIALVICVFGIAQGILLWGFGISIFANIL